MDMKDVKRYFLSKKGAFLDYPFNQEVAVFKVGGKMFGLINVNEPERKSVNLKYPKEKIHEIRSVFPDIIPGYHMHKEHWNTVYIDRDLEEEFIKELIDISYDIVFNSLTKKAQKEIIDGD